MHRVGRPRGRSFWLAVAAAGALVLVGSLLIVVGVRRSGSITGVVTAYFNALQRGSAPDALAYGTVPRGKRELLTSTVLEKQQRVAPIEDVAVTVIARHGSRATAKVTYTLAFRGSRQPESTTVGLHRANGSWRLDRVAVATRLKLAQAADRASIFGRPLPTGAVLVFPGVAPIAFDSPYLQLDPATAVIDFETDASTLMATQVSPTGRSRARQLVMAALRRCVGDSATPACPQPNERYVPGSLRGVVQRVGPQFTVDVGSGRAGTIEVDGRVTVAGSFRRLDFRDDVVSGTGAVQVPLAAVSYATRPLAFVWRRP